MKNRVSKFTIQSLLFLSFLSLLSIPVFSFSLAKPMRSKPQSQQVLGAKAENTIYLEGKLKLLELNKQVYEFEVVLQPQEYFVKELMEKGQNKTVYLKNTEEQVYAEIREGNLELINLSENEVVVKGVLY